MKTIFIYPNTRKEGARAVLPQVCDRLRRDGVRLMLPLQFRTTTSGIEDVDYIETGDAVRLAEWLNRSGRQPEQVQDFYPTPGTLSTCMYYTGIDPRTMKPVYVPKDPHEKAMQRALMQWKRPDKRALVLEALRKAGREDLIGFGKGCLVPPYDRRRRKGK